MRDVDVLFCINFVRQNGKIGCHSLISYLFNGFVTHQLSCNFNNEAKSLCPRLLYLLALYNNMHLLRGRLPYISIVSNCILLGRILNVIHPHLTMESMEERFKAGLIECFELRVMHVWLILLLIKYNH
jgi:hypothetical protein